MVATHDPDVTSCEASGGIHRVSLDLERSFDALQSRDSHSAKPLVWAVEALPKKASSVALPGDIIDSPQLVIPLPNQSRSGGVRDHSLLTLSCLSGPVPHTPPKSFSSIPASCVTLIIGGSHFHRHQTSERKPGLEAVAQCAGTVFPPALGGCTPGR